MDDASWRGIDIALSIAAAALVAYGVLVLGWSVFIVMALFWFENVVIGVLNVAKMLITGARLGVAGVTGALALSAFFTVHYGMFTVAHGVFIAMLFGEPELGSVNGLFAPVGRMLDYLFADRDGWIGVVAITAVQLMMFIRWLRSAPDLPATLPALMFAPYGRIMILHVTLIAGGALVTALKAPVLGALLLIALKLVFDIVAASKRAPPRTSPEPVRRVAMLWGDDARRP